jgi:hypothetical protein
MHSSRSGSASSWDSMPARSPEMPRWIEWRTERAGAEASRVADGSDGELFETAVIDRIDRIRLP